MKIDLHSHTYYSDGLLSPKELIQRALNMQVDVLAITDHDTISGIAEARDAVKESTKPGKPPRLEIIAGVEISTSWHNFDIHILGLNVDINDQTFLSRLAEQSQRRDERALQINEKLEKAGVHGVLDKAQKLAGKGQITRAHFARAMVELQAVKDADSAFKKYLGKGKRAHVKPKWISIEEAISWIHDAGGQAVLAHPGHYDMTTKWLRRLVAQFAEAKGDGMEVIHSHLSPVKRQLLIDLTKEHSLLASSGSDFHFPNRWTELGKNLSLPKNVTPVWSDWTFAQAEALSS
ncbi:PHP domain-containing protein [Aestuariibacter sp. AA17]|uniref:PHP domain-containing protein n=1 Tax=Fluctibacter corallii TaxID=2984329 RepID=A0ABT3A591_9ALTE|nr:PHP domain-containing protein [Aestuariibacter sp. AA17]MCV2883863.1 PHP domain-containing protein [Aestuariibacter sp. AA17]